MLFATFFPVAFLPDFYPNKGKHPTKGKHHKISRLQMFFKIGVLKFRNFHGETPVLEFLFNKVAGIHLQLY